MLEDYDPYLANFVDDVGYCISLIFRSIEIFLGISYFCGSKVVSALLWTLDTSIVTYKQLEELGRIVGNEITEFGASFVRAVLLIYYGISKVFESFYIVAVDLQNFYYHVTESLYRTVDQSASFLLTCLTGLFTVVPQQILDALSMVGESALLLKDGTINILGDFAFQLFWSPINVVLTVGKSVITLLSLPVVAVCNMSRSSVLGLIVIVVCFIIFRRLLRYLIFRNFRLLFVTVLGVILRLFSFIRVKVKNFVFSSVSTMSDMRNIAEYSNSTGKVVCVICQDNTVSFMSNPCKHVCLCETCVRNLIEQDNRCPICRGVVRNYDRVFIP